MSYLNELHGMSVRGWVVYAVLVSLVSVVQDVEFAVWSAVLACCYRVLSSRKPHPAYIRLGPTSTSISPYSLIAPCEMDIRRKCLFKELREIKLCKNFACTSDVEIPAARSRVVIRICIHIVILRRESIYAKRIEKHRVQRFFGIARQGYIAKRLYL